MAPRSPAGPVNPIAAARKNMRVLLPFCPKRLPIPDELAADIGAARAHVVVPFGKGKVRRVEVGRNFDGAFLGRGWPEFMAECGAGTGWVLVIRHHGGGVLTVKAFDETGCFRELGTQPPATVEATTSNNGASLRPRFLNVLPQDYMGKMQIPDVFVQNYIPKEHLNTRTALIFGPLGKVGQMEVEMSQSGVFLADGWSQFLACHGITEADRLLLRYERNLVFTLKVFRSNGLQRELQHSGIMLQQNEQNMVAERMHKTPSASIQKCNSKNSWLGSEGQEKAKISKICLDRESLPRCSFYKIGPPSWIEKHINTNSLNGKLALAKTFCDAIGLQESRIITLKTSMDSDSSWQVHGSPCKTGSYLLMGGWRRFCKENRLKEGDSCIFEIVETTLWHVVIKRYNDKVIASANMKRKSKSYRINSEKQMGPEGSVKSLTKESPMTNRSFGAGPPPWFMKKINASTIANQLSLPLTFCKAIGLREPCKITLKTSASSTMSWQAHVVPYENCAHMRNSGWKMFCRENDITVGDVCTFNAVEPMLWHVDITRQ